MATSIWSETSQTTDLTSSWYDVDNLGRFPKPFAIEIQWENAAGTLTGTIELIQTIDKNATASKTFTGAVADTIAIDSASGEYIWTIDPVDLKAFKLKYTENGLTSIDLYARSTHGVI